MLQGITDNSKSNNANIFQNLNPVSSQNDNNYAKKIVLANKGEAGYFPQMDLNDDGIITLDEFNQYCEENSIADGDKQKLFQIMQMAKTINKLQEESEKQQEEKEDTAKETTGFKVDSIYARKGDEKYNEKMDENKDFKITYKEYMDYCAKYANSKDEKQETKTESKNFEIKKALNAYNKEETQEAQIQVESEA